MTPATKFLTYVLVEAGLIGAAFGAGYLHHQRTSQPLLLSCEQHRAGLEQTGRVCEARATRGLIMEAEVGLLAGNPAYASERLLRAQLNAQRAGLKFDDQFDALSGRVLANEPQAREQLLRLADKIAMLPTGAPPTPGKGTAPPAPAGAPADPAAKPANPAGAGADAPPAAAALAAPPAPAANSSADSSQRALDEGRRALLDAKIAVISGGEAAVPAALIQKLAHARVMLDEAGMSDLDEAMDGAIDAVKKHDDARVRSTIDTVLQRTRR